MNWKEPIKEIFEPGGGINPVQYFGAYNGNNFYVRYRGGWISVEMNDNLIFETCIGDQYDGKWTDKMTSVYLSILACGIIENNIQIFSLPKPKDCSRHPNYEYGPYPLKAVGLSCMKREVAIPAKFRQKNRHDRKKIKTSGFHSHEVKCTIYVPADQYDEWKVSNPESHKLFREEYPEMHKWEESMRG